MPKARVTLTVELINDEREPFWSHTERVDQNYYTDPDDVPYAAAPTSALAAAKQASSFVRTDMLNVIDVRWPRYEEA